MMVTRLLSLLLALVVLSYIQQPSSAFFLQLQSTEARCVFDLLKKDMLATGYYAVAKRENGQPTGVNVVVTDPQGETVFAAENADEGKFAYTARLGGRFVTCVRNTNLLPKEVELKLKSGVEAKDLSEVAQKDHLMPLGVELLRLEQVAEEVRIELKALFKSEADMRDVNEETNSRVRFTTAFSLFVILSVGAWQIVYVRKFLSAKKVV